MLRIEVAVPVPNPSMDDFDFYDAQPLPFLSAPSTPRRFGTYSLSAPSSPTRMTEFYDYFDKFPMMDSYEETNGVPSHWEEMPGTPKSPKGGTSTLGEDDFAFEFSAEQEKASLAADELFDGGKIRPQKPSPRLQIEDRGPLASPRSPRSPIGQGKKIMRNAFSPRKDKDWDPFAAAVENTRNRKENERGRERVSCPTSNSSRRATRSVSPILDVEYPGEEEEKQLEKITKQSALGPKASSPSNSSSCSKSSSRKWRLKDFLLFRSASEGRAHDKYPLRLFRKHEDAKDESLQSTDNSCSVSSRRKGQVSAHELHYTMNKAVSQNLKKKTFLPYKQGILGRLAFNPAAHAVANGFGTLAR